ncbi:3-oxoacyl-[acyl-carrier-protein] synthase III C-terminal domain-containing protein [Hyalangium versicolor]|uniref:3-oxoacyl-[acyl-carrier-protein] synthase III C-terminal domain-containing protein n=1 Tax=Hyalangium versicolor TaxID=2861190 RepID=UPI001CCEB4C1|nr:3-oxoacyl-[acyl-carrier-protein] synthase III C-terminal domain-containing protein [Hyalangium versicolor]
MMGIASTAYVLAKTSCTVSEWCTAQALAEDRLQALSRNGAARFHRAQEEGLIALGSEAISKVLETGAVAADELDALVICHTSPLSALPMPYTLAGALRRACGLAHAYALGITQQQCVSSLHALRVLDALFTRHRAWRSAVIVTLDTIIRENYRLIGDSGVHSDAASAVLLQRNAPGRVHGLQTYNDPRAVQGVMPDTLYGTSPHYVWTLVSVIRRVLRAAGIAPGDLSTILPHNVNLQAWHQVLASLAIPEERLFHDNFARVGHAFGSDVAINIADSGALSSPGYHLVFSSGIGGCFGGFILNTATTPPLHPEKTP